MRYNNPPTNGRSSHPPRAQNPANNGRSPHHSTPHHQPTTAVLTSLISKIRCHHNGRFPSLFFRYNSLIMLPKDWFNLSLRNGHSHPQCRSRKGKVRSAASHERTGRRPGRAGRLVHRVPRTGADCPEDDSQRLEALGLGSVA
ncbi:MAG: hypothetical protein M5U34_26370 [Chloroflexi bacterium]|nr:hypothetical protein [Chloroflexota bacterium]